MEKKDIKNIISGLSWSFGERILAQGITFGVSIILARILSPTEYGLIALTLVFINLSNVFVVSGFGEALIQKKDIKSDEFSTMFWISISFSLVLYIILYNLAPFIAKLYKIDNVVWILRVLALKLPLASMNTIQRAYLIRKMEFKKFFFSTLGGTLISGIVGVILAYKGFGVWALVFQYMINSSIDTLILSLIIKWKPKLIFNINSAKTLFNYSWKITGATFINELYSEIRTLIIGRVYTPADLAFYNRGNQFPSLFITNISSSINTVLFPAMSKLQDKKEELKLFSKNALIFSSYIIFPLLMGLMGISKTLVIILLTDKWQETIPYLQILCLFYVTQPLQAINWQVLKATGRSDLCLKLEIIKKIIGFILILLTMFISMKALAWSATIFAIISTLINMIPNNKLINYPITEQIKDLYMNIFLSVTMYFIVWSIGNIFIDISILTLILQIFIGAFYYIGISYILKIEAFFILYRKIFL